MSTIAWAGAAMFFLSLVHFLWRYFVTFGEPVPDGTGYAGVAINFALFSAFALHHSLLARTRAKTWLNARFRPEVERTLFVWIASVLFLGVAWLWRPVPGMLWELHGWSAWLAWAGQIAGVVFTAWSAATLGIMDLAGLRPILKPAGSSTRDARATLEVRDTGPYGLVRHPIYFSWLLLVWSVPAMNGTRLSFAAISTFYLVIAIPFEERSLVAHFGKAYTQYQSRVRSKMLPYVY